MEKTDYFEVSLMIALLAFAVVLVDERLLRTGLAVLPALILAQRALGHQSAAATTQGRMERRTDDEVRVYIDRLLKHFREFYTTCHLMGANVLTPEAAEERVTQMERDLNRLLAEVTQAAKTRAEPKE